MSIRADERAAWLRSKEFGWVDSDSDRVTRGDHFVSSNPGSTEEKGESESARTPVLDGSFVRNDGTRGRRANRHEIPEVTLCFARLVATVAGAVCSELPEQGGLRGRSFSYFARRAGGFTDGEL